MIDSYDRLVFSDEDLSLLKKSGVIMTDEEAEELKNSMQPNDTEVEMPTEVFMKQYKRILQEIQS